MGVVGSEDRIAGDWYRDFVHPWRWQLAAALFAMAVVSVVSFGQVWFLRQALNTVFGTEDVAAALWRSAEWMVGLSLIRASSAGFLTLTLSRLSDRTAATLQQRAFDGIVAADLDYIQERLSGGLVGRMVHEVGQARHFLGGTLPAAARDAMTAFALCLFMLWTDWRLTLLGVSTFAAAAVALGWLGRRMAVHARATQSGVGRLAGHMGQVFQGLRHVKAYRAEAVEGGRVAALIDAIRCRQEAQARIRCLSAPLVEMIGALALTVFLLVGGGRVLDGHMTPATLITVSGCLLAVCFLLRNLGNAWVAAQNGRMALINLGDLIGLPVKVVDAPDARPLRIGRGDIRFRSVGFAYDGGRGVLHDVDLDIPGGSTVALVGPSGAGKSTVLNLLLRFHDPHRGAIEIDGADIRRVTVASLRDSIALVGQEGSVFDGTIRTNIAYGRPDAGEEDIRAAARAAEAEDFIRHLPDGYDTRVGERGIRLSGGQAQRLALARAFLKDAPILLLDEATSALDGGTERAVLDKVLNRAGRMRSGPTCIIVAHRLSCVMDADMICVMENGRVAGVGRHADLLARNTAYARLWAEQQGGVR